MHKRRMDMEKIGIITDSACDLRANQYNPDLVKIIPLKIIFSDGEFKDGVTISADETYRRMDTEFPKTSLPEGSDMQTALEYFKTNGFTHVVGIFISSGLSGTFNAFQTFAGEFGEGLTIEAIDSKTLSMGEGVLVQLAERLIGEGASFALLVEQIRAKMKRVHVYFVLDTLEYLIKGGRIGKVSGTIGQLLNIKPVIHVNGEGIYHSVDKARGKRQALQKMLSLIKDSYLAKNPCNVYVMHGGTPKEGEEVLAMVRQLDGVKTSYTDQITPSLSVHTGKGLIGLIIEESDGPLL